MQRTAKWFILRGLAAGAAGGAATALFLRFVTETQIGYALRFEEAKGIGLPPGDPARFSRGTQHWGGMAAAVLYGALLGVVLGVVVAALHHKLRGRNEFDRIVKVAGAGFVAIVLLPALKYPANPPTVGNPDTIANRSTEFMLFMAAAVAVVVLGWMLWDRLTERGWDGAPRFLTAGGAFLVLVVALFLAWPASPDPLNPPDSEATPALRVAHDAPPGVLADVLATAKATGDGWLRDPSQPDRPLDLSKVHSPAELRGVPAALSTTKLVPHAYTTIIWHFRLESLAGLALLFAVMAGVFGLLADTPAGARERRSSTT